MSTKSYICKENEDGTYTGIYCHSDGYITHNGAMLFDHYNNRKRVEELISKGSLSILKEKINPDPFSDHGFDYEDRQEDVCVFYGRDRGEEDTEPREVKLEDIDSPNSWIEYCYVYGKDDRWRYFVCGRLDEMGLHDLEDGLDEEYKALGFPRPEQFYGFYSEREIAEYRKKAQASAIEMG